MEGEAWVQRGNYLTEVIYPEIAPGATRLEENFLYDAVGNTKRRTDTANRQTRYFYDQAHHLVRTRDALNQDTRFRYNKRSHMTKVIDAKGQEYQFTYDPLGRQRTQTRDGATLLLTTPWETAGADRITKVMLQTIPTTSLIV